MSKFTLVQAVMKHRSGFDQDSVVNTFAIRSPDLWSRANYGEITIPIASGFYNFVGVGGYSLSSYLSSGMSRAAAGMSLKCYNLDGHLDGSPHGSPFAVDTGTLAAALQTDVIPEECAVVLTLRSATYASAPVEAPDDGDADSVPQRPRQRESGRLFFGPLGRESIDIDGVGRARVDTGLRALLAEAADNLKTQLAVGGHDWCVWSRKDAAMRTVELVQVDDAFDTQRRRGHKASVRVTTDI